MALIIEGNGNDWKFVEYTIPKRCRIFEGEIRNAYLSQTMSNKAFEDKDREILTGYIENNTWNLPVNEQRLDRDVEQQMPRGSKHCMFMLCCCLLDCSCADLIFMRSAPDIAPQICFAFSIMWDP